MTQFGSNPYTNESTISNYMSQADSFPVLNHDEETFYANAFYESRNSLGGWLSRFPRIVLPQIQAARVAQIQVFGKKGESADSSIEEKRQRIISLVSSMETIADHLESLGTNEDQEARLTRNALYESLKKLLAPYVFPFDFYAQCVAELRECKGTIDKGDLNLQSELILMPMDDFDESMTALNSLYREMESSRTALLEANLRIIIKLSRKYMKYGLSFQDLFQEGYFGMTIALDKFEPFRGHRFTTYAVWWVRQSITNALSSQARTIRLPANLGRLLTKIHRTEQALLQQFGRDPTDEEIADRIGQTPGRVRAWRKIEQQPISLESTIGTDENSSIHEVIADAGNKQPDEVVSSKMLKNAVAEVLETLDERERNIIKHRFGIEGKDLMTLEELSRRYEVSHERIRQIESAALKKLRSPDRRKFFDGYY